MIRNQNLLGVKYCKTRNSMLQYLCKGIKPKYNFFTKTIKGGMHYERKSFVVGFT